MCLCVCVCLCASLNIYIYLSFSLCVAAGEEIDIHDALADTMSLNVWVNF